MTNPFESEGLVEELSIAGEERATMGLTSRAEEGGFGGYLELEEARGFELSSSSSPRYAWRFEGTPIWSRGRLELG